MGDSSDPDREDESPVLVGLVVRRNAGKMGAVQSMNGLLRRLVSYGNATDLLGIASDFRDITVEQREIIARQKDEILQLKLDYARWGAGVVENFLTALDKPEIEIRGILVDALTDFKDEVARLEEHSGV